MPVYNVHERPLPADQTAVGRLIDTLTGADDRLWPRDRWPAMWLDRPLGTGATGGHGPIRYTVAAYVPSRWVRFAFTRPRGFDGFHEYAVLADRARGVVLRHTLAMRTHGLARLSWALVFRPLHDALLEDSLDRAERAVTGHVARPARWSWYVRLLRWLFARRRHGRDPRR